MIKILSLFRDRDNQDPDLGSVDGKHLSTLSKIELMAEFEKRGLNADELCRIGGIEPQQENLCRLLHFQMEVGSGEATATCTPGPSGQKKRKTETTTVRFWVTCLCASAEYHSHAYLCSHVYIWIRSNMIY